jgi:hypothetical protein
VLHLSFSSHHTLWALVVGAVGAVLFGGVLGVLQWLVVWLLPGSPRKDDDRTGAGHQSVECPPRGLQ